MIRKLALKWKKGNSVEKKDSFEKAYSKFETEYCEAVQELLVLTSESVGGACLYEKGIWEPSVKFLASVDLATGEFREEKGFLRWLVEEEVRRNGKYKMKPLTIYHVRCRKRKKDLPGEAALENTWMLLDVVRHGQRHPELERVLKDYQRVVTFTDADCGRFELERRFDWFSAEVDWLGKMCTVSLDCDEDGGETADGALLFFKQIYGNLQEWDRQLREFAAEELTALANEWMEETDGEETVSITKESFAKRIQINELCMKKNGDYTAYYADDDMFYDHVIVIQGNVKTGMEGADIAG